ncbi:capsule biosynthesis GfcC family protein [Vibrio europaeus]|nr:capsule biosynthesis GfcC family protein [Vibrio europaeus]
MKRLTLFLSLSIAPLISSASENTLSISLPSEQFILHYNNPVRLAQVLSDTVSQSHNSSILVSPSTNQLFNLVKEPQITSKKRSVIKKLNQLASSEPQLKLSINGIVKQIASWDVGYKESISLDFDVVRVFSHANPLLVGHYELLIQGHKESVLVEGLVSTPKQIKFSATKSISDYLSDCSLSREANSSFAWVIYPDGTYMRSGFAYWNNENQSLAPGSSIFIGFNLDTKEVLSLEQDIVDLITMRRGL